VTPSASGPLAGWPADRPLAVSLSVMLEGWAEGSAPGIGPMGNHAKSPGFLKISVSYRHAAKLEEIL